MSSADGPGSEALSVGPEGFPPFDGPPGAPIPRTSASETTPNESDNGAYRTPVRQPHNTTSSMPATSLGKSHSLADDENGPSGQPPPTEVTGFPDGDPPVSLSSTDDGDGPSGQTPSIVPMGFPGNAAPPSIKPHASKGDGPFGQPPSTSGDEIPIVGPGSGPIPNSRLKLDGDDPGPGSEGPSTGGDKFPDGHPTPPFVKNFHVPGKFPIDSTLLIQLNLPNEGQTDIKVVKPPIPLPEAAEFALYTSEDDKILYLETYELSFRLQLVKALVSDMKARSKALVDVTSRINALEAMDCFYTRLQVHWHDMEMYDPDVWEWTELCRNRKYYSKTEYCFRL